jgi:aspartyl-tRNA(Asn)/glutamyl-tRNA(Gln) amidotransferase subunit A
MSLAFMSLAQVSEALTRGEISSVELVDEMLARIDGINPRLNAFLRIDTDLVRAQARAADLERSRGQVRSPLHGIPLAHKDMFYRAGVPSSCGSAVTLPVPRTTSTALERLDVAGALQLGVLNMTAFAVGPTGHNRTTGDCRNPWNVERITGGSSSGSAAAVAGGASFAALGSDTAGSIRIPAALCGVTGLKPTYGRVSRAGTMGLSFTLDTVGLLARSALDCAMILNVIAGPDDADPTTATVGRAEDYLRGIERPVRGLRVGIPTRYFNEGLDRGIDRALEESLLALKELGCTIVPVQVPDMAAVDAAAGLIFSCEVAALHQELIREQHSAYGKQMLIRLERGFAVPAPSYVNAIRYRSVAVGEFAKSAFSEADVLHLPVIPIRTPTIEASDIETGEGVDSMISELTRFTRPINYLGLPALALPIGFSSDGMPITMQLVGRPFGEDLLFRLGHAYQLATDWHLRRPPLC